VNDWIEILARWIILAAGALSLLSAALDMLGL
jgi:hypothetical protein